MTSVENETATTTMKMYKPSDIEKIVVYIMPGSQFAAKALVALDSRKIKHECFYVAVSLEQRKKQIPSGGTLVPEIQITLKDGGDPIVVSDSEGILHWFDDHYENAKKFFPTTECSDLSMRVSDGVLAGCVYYYNWVHNDGYNRSMKNSFRKFLAIPSWMPSFVSSGPLDMLLNSSRKKFAVKAADAIKLDGVDKDALTNEDEPKVKKALLEELAYLQSLLKDDDENTELYFFGHKQATAADISVYAQIERLVGDMGDGKVSASIPDLKKDETSLKLLWKWHDGMRKNHPIKFRGKRAGDAKK
eukprot:CAMPEP_0119560334 /NCGR_PEP_ID=MMETSP1352-20130426/14605_1 /TAXON_ID=265584 /ORGANISM="Stauroneis constricta, Strain CCMP1120" /LENGTH=302 /DNA_ID=CAMNT_0007608293 /DNA_START=346 /DNA_END=1254 /DNA_ORIENTATION=-